MRMSEWIHTFVVYDAYSCMIPCEQILWITRSIQVSYLNTRISALPQKKAACPCKIDFIAGSADGYMGWCPRTNTRPSAGCIWIDFLNETWAINAQDIFFFQKAVVMSADSVCALVSIFFCPVHGRLRIASQGNICKAIN